MAYIYQLAGLLMLATFGICTLQELKNKNLDLVGLDFLGTIEGVSYFVEANQTMTWHEARLYCKQATMELATVKTKIQADELTKLLRQKYSYGSWWISAREAQRSIAGLEWDKIGEQLDNSFSYWNFGGFSAYFYCGNFHVGVAGNPWIQTLPCLYELCVLCQIA